MSDINDTNENTEAKAADTMTSSEVHSFCRHMGRTLKSVSDNHATLALHMMKEAEYLKTNGFGNASEMFAIVAGVIDPSLPVKMEIARREN